MIYWYKKPVLLILIFLLSATSVQAEDDPAVTKKQISQLDAKIKKLQARLSQQEGDSRELSKALKKSEILIGNIARQIKIIDKQLTGLDTRAGQLESKRDALKAELNKRARLIEKQIVQQYKMGKKARLQLLLTQRDPEKLDRIIRYYDFVNTKLHQDMEQFQTKLLILDDTEQELGSTERQMIKKRHQLKAEIAQLQQSRDERKSTLAALKKTLSHGDTRLKQMKLDQERLQAVLKAIEEDLNFATLVKDSKTFRQQKGKLPWPLQGRIKQKFGTVSNHVSYDGIWIAAKEGQIVKAIHHGRVVFSDWLRGYGLVLIIDHGAGYMTLYGYNQSLLLETGDWVDVGDPIATAGNSGGRNANGLYFAVRYKGKPSNPQHWLTKK